jgi:hypothetical protein
VWALPEACFAVPSVHRTQQRRAVVRKVCWLASNHTPVFALVSRECVCIECRRTTARPATSLALHSSACLCECAMSSLRIPLSMCVFCCDMLSRCRFRPRSVRMCISHFNNTAQYLVSKLRRTVHMRVSMCACLHGTLIRLVFALLVPVRLLRACILFIIGIIPSMHFTAHHSRACMPPMSFSCLVFLFHDAMLPRCHTPTHCCLLCDPPSLTRGDFCVLYSHRCGAVHVIYELLCWRRRPALRMRTGVARPASCATSLRVFSVQGTSSVSSTCCRGPSSRQFFACEFERLLMSAVLSVGSSHVHEVFRERRAEAPPHSTCVYVSDSVE